MFRLGVRDERDSPSSGSLQRESLTNKDHSWGTCITRVMKRVGTREGMTFLAWEQSRLGRDRERAFQTKSWPLKDHMRPVPLQTSEYRDATRCGADGVGEVGWRGSSG